MIPNHRHGAVIIAVVAFLAVFLAVQPAQAFYFRLPSALQQAIDSLKSSARAQDAGEAIIQPAPSSVSNGSQPQMTPSVSPAESQPVATPMPIFEKKEPIQSDNFNQSNPSPTCRVDGVEMPGSCEQYKNNSESNQMSPNDGSDGQKQDQNQEQNNARMLKDIKRSANDLSRQLKQFVTLMTKFEKKGVKISDDIKAKVETVKSDIAKLQSITSAEEAQDLDINGMWDAMRDLEEERQNMERLDNITREMKRIEGEVKRFSQQIVRLEKNKMTVPAGIKENVEKVKAKIDEIKGGQIENAEDIWELMEAMNQDRQTLEIMSRWPQTVKDVAREVKRLETELKRVKTIVARLVKKGLDLSDNLEKFTTEVERVKAVKADAEAKMAAGEVEDALNILQNDFFGQMEDVWQEHKIIMTMSNLGQFSANFQKEINQAKQEINALKRKKVDVTELEDLLNQAVAKGDEVKAMMKVKPVDYDAVVALMEELEDLGGTFDDKAGELRGDNEVLPWEKGAQQFKEIKMSPTMEKLLPRKEVQVEVAQPAVTTAPVQVVQ